MPYTVWSHGRLLGETELAYVRCMHKHRAGDFHPTEFGETVMPIANGERVAMKEFAKVMRHVPLGSDDESVAARKKYRASPQAKAAEAECEAATERCNALALELRRADGSIVPTEDIDIRDTELLWDIEPDDDDLGFDEESDCEFEDEPEDDPSVLHDLEIIEEIRAARGVVPDEPSGHEFPRYQIMLRLLDDAAIP